MTTKETTGKRYDLSTPLVESCTNIFFIGIGGIGMSNLARFFLAKKKTVGGYDRTPTKLSQLLETEGALIHYEDDIKSIPTNFLNPLTTMVVYTPAVPPTNREFNYFLNNGFTLLKRAQVMGEIT